MPVTSQHEVASDNAAVQSSTSDCASERFPEAHPSQRPPSLEASSINSIMRQHPRERIYVHPILWTAKHLELLGIKFVDESYVECETAMNESNNVADLKLVQSVAMKAASLSPTLSRKTRIQAVTAIASIYGLSKSCRSYLHFDFAKQAVCFVPTDGVFEISTTTLAAILDLDTIARIRRNIIPKPNAKRVNLPGLRIRRKKLAHVQPGQAALDPYIAATMVCLAQKQRKINTVKSIGSSQDIEVRLFTMNARYFYLHRAEVTTMLLDRLDNPQWRSLSPSISIYCCRLSFGRSETCVAQANDDE